MESVYNGKRLNLNINFVQLGFLVFVAAVWKAKFVLSVSMTALARYFEQFCNILKKSGTFHSRFSEGTKQWALYLYGTYVDSSDVDMSMLRCLSDVTLVMYVRAIK